MNHLVFGNIVKETCRRLNSADAKRAINGEAIHYGAAEIYMSVDMNHSQPELVTQVLLDTSHSPLPFDVLTQNFEQVLANQEPQVTFFTSNENSKVITVGFRRKIDSVNCKTLSDNLRTISNLHSA